MIEFLKEALALAKQHEGHCAPNPAVGAVVVKDQHIIARGAHRGAGCAHAEVEALKSLSYEQTRGASLYLSLEPCCHWGRTPPCTDAIIQAGIAHVVFAFQDLNPEVAGESGKILASNGIHCEQVSLPEIDEFYQPYVHWWRTQMPWVCAKLAMSLDAKIAQSDGSPVAITGPECQTFTHQMRRRSDALLTTARTILNDNPSMNVRLTESEAKTLYILDTRLETPLDARIHQTAKKMIVFHDINVDAEKIDKFHRKNITCHGVPYGPDGLNLEAVLRIIGADGVHRLWVEAGGHCFSQFCLSPWIQQAWLYIAPQCLGVQAIPAFPLGEITWPDTVSWQQCGQDVIAEFKWER